MPLSRDTAWHAHSTDTGFFEEAQYRYTANASNPSCIQATIFWQHGKFGLNDNGSITLYPFSSDGRIQVQDPCAATTNIITYYNQQVSCASDNLDLARSSLAILPCASLRHRVAAFRETLTDVLVQTLYADWGITIDQSTGNYRLLLNRFDGAKMPYVRCHPLCCSM